MLYERAKKEVEAISEQISSIKCQLEAFPPGKLICCNHKTHTKWYHKNQEQIGNWLSNLLKRNIYRLYYKTWKRSKKP